MAKYLKIALISVILFSTFILSVPSVKAITIAEIQAQISIISAQIQDLIKQLAALQTPSCVPNWKCDWGPCENGFEPQIPVDSSKCGVPITQANITCPFSTRQCVSAELPVKFTLLSSEANIMEYGIDDYIATGTIRFKVKLSAGTMQQFTGAKDSLDKTMPMVVINAYDSNGQLVSGKNPYRNIIQTPSKDLISGEEAIITVQQTVNFSSKDNIKSMRFKIDAVNFEVNHVLQQYSDIGSWYTNLASLPAISQHRLNLLANIAEVIRKLSQTASQLLGF